MLRPLKPWQRTFHRPYARLRPSLAVGRRLESTAADGGKNEGLPDEPPLEPSGRRDAWMYVSHVFPIRLAVWDIRYLIARVEKEDLLDRIRNVLAEQNTHGFKLLGVEAAQKDGGVFIHFEYSSPTPSVPSPSSSTTRTLADYRVLREIEADVRRDVDKHGGFATWKGWGKADVWLVRGKPWREDLNRFPSPMLRVEFDGPDVDQESLYDILRPFGRISDITSPTPVPSGTLRSSLITFTRIDSATIARNCLHGVSLSPHAHDLGGMHAAGVESEDGKLTRLRMVYERQIKDHLIRDWLGSHPRIVLPAAAFLLATLTYTIFDPVRAFFVEAKVLDWLDYRNYSAFKWLRRNTIDRLSFEMGKKEAEPSVSAVSAWRERQDAAGAMVQFLSEEPTNFALVTGPEGAGKSAMIQHAIQGKRNALTIDCAEICKASSDAALVTELAKQTGYWPVFSVLASINNMLDLASVGLIGQKAGFSTSIDQQMKQVLEVVAKGLESAAKHHRDSAKRRVQLAQAEAELKEGHQRQVELMRRGGWHDGRLDCVAGNGVMSELGVGDERFGEEDWDPPRAQVGQVEEGEKEKEREREKPKKEKDEIDALPVVVIKNWAMKGAKRDVLWEVLSGWAAALVDNKIAHVIFVSDNSSAPKSLAKALPSKPITTVALTDADTFSALAFVAEKLREAGKEELSEQEMSKVRALGGRLTDLESFVAKVRNGQRVEDAVEEIIARNVAELRKNAFGDDTEDAGKLPWTKEQAWGVFRRLAKEEEVPYADVLLDYPFRGDEGALRALEHDEFIAIMQQNGRPSTIRAGKPVYYSVFQRLTDDPIFSALQDTSYNERAIALAESAIKAAEQELGALTSIGLSTGNKSWVGSGALEKRADYLLRKIGENEAKLEGLEKQNAGLRKVLRQNINVD